VCVCVGGIIGKNLNPSLIPEEAQFSREMKRERSMQKD